MPEFDDAWYEEWTRGLEASGGNVILALGLRPTAVDAERCVMEMPMSGNVRQGTGVFAAGALIQLADVGATIVCDEAMNAEGPKEGARAFPLSVQISTNLLRNSNQGKAVSTSRVIHKGRTMMVVESEVRDDRDRLLAVVTSTHVVSYAQPAASG